MPLLAPHRKKTQRLAYHCLSILFSLCLACLALGVQAQERSGAEPPGRSGLPSLPTLEDQPAKPPIGPILPPLPPVAPEERQRLSQQVRVFVGQIRVEGNTVFPEGTRDVQTYYIIEGTLGQLLQLWPRAMQIAVVLHHLDTSHMGMRED